MQDKSRQDHLHTDLAPGFVGLTKDSIKMMDDKLKVRFFCFSWEIQCISNAVFNHQKVMIAGCNIELTRLKPEEVRVLYSSLLFADIYVSANLE